LRKPYAKIKNRLAVNIKIDCIRFLLNKNNLNNANKLETIIMIRNKVSLAALILTNLLLAACSNSVEIKQASSEQSTNKEHSSHTPITQPNVLFILVDDMGFGDVGYNGSEIATPNLDQMANTGMKLDRNYVYPVCSPTRAALLTGQNPLHMGIEGPIADDASLPPETKIMPAYFKDLGYQTHMIGKWHLGLAETDAWPTAKGFDSYYGFLGGWIDFYTHVFAGGLDWQRDGVSVREEGYSTDLMTDEAIRLIETRGEQPFLMWLSYNAPHSPLQHPPSYSGLNHYPETSDRSVYAEMVTYVDAAIGRVMAELKQQGILENTIVIFSSDNGGAPQLGASNGDLRGGKRSSLEGGMRVPGLISWAGTIEPGSVLQQPIAVHDWLPTLLEAVNADPSAVDKPYGQSMWAAIADGEKINRHNIIMGATNNLGAYEWPYKLVKIKNENTAETEIQLFNVVTDPQEKNDLAAQMPTLTNRLLAAIDAMPVPEVNRLEPEYNNSPRYYPKDKPTYDARHFESKTPWAEAAIRSDHPLKM
jgi:arylsulfatase A-like enzyme